MMGYDDWLCVFLFGYCNASILLRLVQSAEVVIQEEEDGIKYEVIQNCKCESGSTFKFVRALASNSK
jgi:hypothetical protein